MPLTKRQPKALEALLTRLGGRVESLMNQLTTGDLSLSAWQAAMTHALTVHSTAAYLAGRKSKTLTAEQRSALAERVATQVSYLKGFTADLAAAEMIGPAEQARAQLYAQSIKASYWAGRTRDLPLPAMPGDGSTACLTNCGCAWSVIPVDAAQGDYDCYWVRHTSDSCATCRDRAADWSPYEIRGSDKP